MDKLGFPSKDQQSLNYIACTVVGWVDVFPEKSGHPRLGFHLYTLTHKS